MKDVLSNEEIDTLLEMFRSEELEEGTEVRLPEELRGAAEPLVRPADLCKPNRLSMAQVRGLERAMESGAKALTATVSERLRLDMECECVAIEQLLFGNWLEALSGPVAIYVLKLEPWRQPVLLAVNTSLLYGTVDRILGGSGRVESVPEDFTAAEYAVADAFVQPCVQRICEALADLAELRPAIQNRFCNPALAQILSPQEVVVAIHFQVSGEFLLGDLRLMFAHSDLESCIDRLDTGERTAQPPGALRDTLAGTIQDVSLEMTVELGRAALPLRQLLALECGDVVPLETRVGDALVAPVQGVPKFLGQVGIKGSRLAFRIGEVRGASA